MKLQVCSLLYKINSLNPTYVFPYKSMGYCNISNIYEKKSHFEKITNFELALPIRKLCEVTSFPCYPEAES